MRSFAELKVMAAQLGKNQIQAEARRMQLIETEVQKHVDKARTRLEELEPWLIDALIRRSLKGSYVHEHILTIRDHGNNMGIFRLYHEPTELTPDFLDSVPGYTPLANLLRELVEKEYPVTCTFFASLLHSPGQHGDRVTYLSGDCYDAIDIEFYFPKRTLT